MEWDKKNLKYPDHMKPKCENCKYWAGHSEESSKGFCVLNPPVPAVVVYQSGCGIDGYVESDITSAWPETSNDDWCGQWEEKDD